MTVTNTPEQLAEVAELINVPSTGIRLALEKAGGPSKVAHTLGVSRSVVNQWMVLDRVPGRYVMAVALLSRTNPLELVGEKLKKLFNQIAQYK